jgi:hypothetical protein
MQTNNPTNPFYTPIDDRNTAGRQTLMGAVDAQQTTVTQNTEYTPMSLADTPIDNNMQTTLYEPR